MGCNTLIEHLENAGLEPKGDTYAITVSPYDKIVLTIKHNGIEIQTEVRIAILAKTIDQSGKMGVETELQYCDIYSKYIQENG